MNASITMLVPKLVAIVTYLCPLCTGVSQMNSMIAQTLSENQTMHAYVAYTDIVVIFVIFFAYFGQNLVPVATSLRLLQTEMSSSDLLTTKTPML